MSILATLAYLLVGICAARRACDEVATPWVRLIVVPWYTFAWPVEGLVKLGNWVGK